MYMFFINAESLFKSVIYFFKKKFFCFHMRIFISEEVFFNYYLVLFELLIVDFFP